MSVIEECARAVEALDKVVVNQNGRYVAAYLGGDYVNVVVKTVLKTLAGKLDGTALSKASEAVQANVLSTTTEGYDVATAAIRSYLNQLINEEKE